MLYLSLTEVLFLHRKVISSSGGSDGIRDLGRLQAALGQPRQTFDGADLYPSVTEKAVALSFALIVNHPFVDGNKRIGHATLEATLMLNGKSIAADVDEAERTILDVAAGRMKQDEFLAWAKAHLG